MQKLNIKFLAIFFVCMLCFVGGVHLLHGYNVSKTSRLMLSSAETAVEEGNTEKAIRLYVTFDKHNGETDSTGIRTAAEIALERYKSPAATSRDFLQVYQLINTTLRREPENQDLRREYIKMLVDDPRFGDERMGTALIEIKKLREAGVEDAEILYLSARGNEALGHYDEAIDSLSRLTGYDPGSEKFGSVVPQAKEKLEAYVLLASILQQRKNASDVADMVIDRMVSENPANGQAYLMRGAFHRMTNTHGSPEERKTRAEQADADTRLAYEKSPENAEVILEMAQLATREKDHDLAAKLLTAGVKAYPDDTRFIPRMALATRMAGQNEEAIKFARRGLAEHPENQQLMLLLFELQLDSQKLASARETVAEMQKFNFPSLFVEMSNARIDLREGKARQAAQGLERARTQFEKNPHYRRILDLELGDAYRRLGQPDLQLETFDRLLTYEPTSLPGLRGRVAALQQLGQTDDAIATLQTIGRVMGSDQFMADTALAGTYLQLLKVKLRRDPDNRRLAAMIEQLTGAVVKTAEGDEDRQKLISVAESLKAQNLDEALEKIELIVAEAPENASGWLNLIQIVTQRDGAAAGLKRLDEAKQKVGDNALIRLLEARLLVEVGGDDVDERIDRLAENMDDLSEADRTNLLVGLGSVYWSKGQNVDRARKFWELARQSSPEDPVHYHRLFDIARLTQDAEALQKIADEIGKQFGVKSSLSNYVQARMLVDRFQRDSQDPTDLAKARRLVEAARKERKTWHVLAQLLGDIERLEGDPESAVRQYLVALNSGPPDANTIRITASLLMQLNRFDEASEVLALLNGGGDENYQKLKLVSDVYTGNSKNAIESLAKVVPKDSTDASDWLWKGQILRRLEKSDDAQAAFRHAVDLAPDEPTAWGLLVEQLVLNDKKQEAEEVTREAETRLPEDVSALLLARCHALLGNYREAEHYYRAALDASPSDLSLKRAFATFLIQINRIAPATNVLKEMVGSKSVDRANRPHLQWSRRALAELTAYGGDYGRFQQAIKLVEANVVDGELSVDDLRVLASLHGNRNEPASTRQALALLERIEEKQSLDTAAKLLKARMLDRKGEWIDSQDLMLQAVAEQPTPQSMAIFARMLLDHESPRKAAGWVNRLAEQAPDSPQVVQMKAEVYLKLDRPDRAVDALNEWIDATQEENQIVARLRMAAGLMEQNGEQVYARKYFERLVKLNPESDLEMVAFNARTGEIGPAFAKLDSRFSAATAMPICQLGTTLLRERAGDLSAADRKQIADWFDRARELLPNSLQLEFEWASYNDVLGNDEETIRAYRKLLPANLPPMQHSMVANNLAFKLALRKESLNEALQLVNLAIDTLGPASALLDTRGMVYLQMEDTDLAMRDFKDATSIKATPELHFHLALAYQSAADASKAYEAIENARLEGFDQVKLTGASRKQYNALMAWLRR